MDSAVPMLLFLGFLFASTLLILVLGYRNCEEERAREAKERGLDDALGVDALRGAPGFFSPLAPETAPAGARTVAQRVSAHVGREWRLASDFGRLPCVDSLYRSTRPDVEALAAEISAYVETERRRATTTAREFGAEESGFERLGAVPARVSRAAPGAANGAAAGRDAARVARESHDDGDGR